MADTAKPATAKPSSGAACLAPRDRLGFRAKLGVIVPSTNTIVQPEFDAMRPLGVSNHVSRIGITNRTPRRRRRFRGHDR